MTERLVAVDWEDSGIIHGWRSRRDAAELTPILFRSVGYVRGSDARRMVLSSSRTLDSDEVNDADCPTAIPRSAIRAVHTIRDPRMGKKKTKQRMIDTQATNKRKKGGQKKRRR